MVRGYSLDKDTAVLVGGGGGARPSPRTSPTPAAWRAGSPATTSHQPIGVALALVREQVERIVPGARRSRSRRPAEAERRRRPGAAPKASRSRSPSTRRPTPCARSRPAATELRTQDRFPPRERHRTTPCSGGSLKADPAAVHVLAGPLPHVYGTETTAACGRPVPHRIVDVRRRTSHAANARVETTTVAGAPEVLAGWWASPPVRRRRVRAPALRLLLGSASPTCPASSPTLLALAPASVRRGRPTTGVAVLEVRS